MQIHQWLKQAQRQLEQAGISTARLDALVLLQDTLKKDKSWLLAHPEAEISPSTAGRLKNLLNQRAQHIPLAYVRKKAEFYGRDYIISPAVLQPRPESETMIDELKKLAHLPKKPNIADIGCGSGALGITAKLELPEAVVTLVDIDEGALQVAQRNVDLFTIGVELRKQDLLASHNTPYDVLLCNLPYVPDDFQINRAALHEPRIAIFGGPDGLDVYRRLFEQVAVRPSKPLYILCEAMPPQHPKLQAIATQNDYKKHTINDFVVVFKRTPKRT